MTRTQRLSRRVVALFAAALLLQAAVPLLARLAADARGVPLAEVCPLYGVATVAVAGPSGAKVAAEPAPPAAPSPMAHRHAVGHVHAHAGHTVAAVTDGHVAGPADAATLAAQSTVDPAGDAATSLADVTSDPRAVATATVAVDRAMDPAGAPGGDAERHRDPASHAGGHCALSGWVAIAFDGAPAASPTVGPRVVGRAAPASRPAFVFDPAARWVALLERGPPRFS